MQSTTSRSTAFTEAATDDSQTMVNYNDMLSSIPLLSHTPAPILVVPEVMPQRDSLGGIYSEITSARITLYRKAIVIETIYAKQGYLPYWRLEQLLPQYGSMFPHIPIFSCPNLLYGVPFSRNSKSGSPVVGGVSTNFSSHPTQPDLIVIKVSCRVFSALPIPSLTLTGNEAAFLRRYCFRLIVGLRTMEYESGCQLLAQCSRTEFADLCLSALYDSHLSLVRLSLFPGVYSSLPLSTYLNQFFDCMDFRRLNHMAVFSGSSDTCVTGPHGGLASLCRRYEKSKRAWWRSSQRLTD